MEYSFIDNFPVDGLDYFRFKQIGFDGGFEYSKIISINIFSDENINISPNPFSGFLQIKNRNKNGFTGKYMTAPER